MKNRERQRANRKQRRQEERIEKRNAYGAMDLTAYNAVQRIRTRGRASIEFR